VKGEIEGVALSAARGGRKEHQ